MYRIGNSVTLGTYIIGRDCHHTPAFLHYRGEKQPLSGCLLFRAALLSIFKTYREKRHTKKEQLGMVFSALRSEGIQCMGISKYITIYQVN